MSKQGYAAQIEICEDDGEWGIYAVATLFGITLGDILFQIGLHCFNKGGWWWVLALGLVGSALCLFFCTIVNLSALYFDVKQERRLHKVSQDPPALRIIT